MDDSLESRQSLAARLRTAGCDIDVLNGTEWHSAGNFNRALVPPDVTAPKGDGTQAQARESILVDKMKAAIRAGVPGKAFKWRHVSTLANKAGITEAEALSLLQVETDDRGKCQVFCVNGTFFLTHPW